MLGKLIKHDFRALSRTLMPLQLGVLAGGVLAAILMRISLWMLGSAENGANLARGTQLLFSFLLSLFTGILVFAVLASALITLLLICIRLQKSLFGDEGYLTFSLPVRVDGLLFSKLITGAIWIAINACIIALTMFLFTGFGMADGTFFSAGVLGFAGSLFQGFFDLIGGLFTAEAVPGMWLMSLVGIIDMLVFVLLQMLLLYFAVIAGSSAFKKHWLLAAIGVYLLSTFCLGFLISTAGVLAVAGIAILTPVAAVWIVLLAAFLLMSGVSAGLYFWTRHLLTKRLNLQ